MIWFWFFIFLCVLFAVWQLCWTRQHGRNLDEHQKRMDEIYAKHSRDLDA